MVKIAVMASGSGTNFEELARSCAAGTIAGQIKLLIYDRKAAFAAERAKRFGITAEYINRRDFSSETDRDAYILQRLNDFDIDLIVLAGYLTRVGEGIVNAFENRIINLHPSLIPAFSGKGFFGHHVHEAAINYGVRLSGATVHFVDSQMDTGPIILQEAVPVLPDDTPQTLAERISHVEHKLLPEAVRLFCADRLKVLGRKVVILDELSELNELNESKPTTRE